MSTRKYLMGLKNLADVDTLLSCINRINENLMEFVDQQAQVSDFFNRI
jgi:hypothetical protein